MGKIYQGTETVQIAAPPETVWAIVTDVANHPSLAGSGEVKAIRMGGPLAKGSMWEADEYIKGPAGHFTARSECLVLDAPREFSWRSFPPEIKKGEPRSVADVQWWFRLEPKGSGTLVEHRFRVEAPQVRAGMFNLFYAVSRRPNTIVKGMRKTLENLKTAAEGRRGAAAV